MTKKKRYETILAYFREAMPVTKSELNYNNNYELLVAVMLSAQCTDKRINQVTPELFKAYPTPVALAAADDFEVFEYIKSVSYPNAKAHHLVEMAKIVVSEFDSKIPDNMDDLLKLPGVGRKTANVIQAVAFGKAAMAVDTHIYRVSHRLGLVAKTHNNPYKVEMELMKHIPETDIPNAHHWLLLHGRYVCTSQKPKCSKCPFTDLCPYFKNNK